MAITHYKFTVYVLLIFSCGHLDILKVLYIHTLDALTVVFKYFLLFMAALWNRAGHYIFILWFLLLSSFFPCVFSAVADWMSTILPHMMWP